MCLWDPLSLGLCALSCRVVIESLAAAAAVGARGLEHDDGSCSLAASSARRLSMETGSYVGTGKRKLLFISMGDRWHGVELWECNYTQWVSGRNENPPGLCDWLDCFPSPVTFFALPRLLWNCYWSHAGHVPSIYCSRPNSDQVFRPTWNVENIDFILNELFFGFWIQTEMFED